MLPYFIGFGGLGCLINTPDKIFTPFILRLHGYSCNHVTIPETLLESLIPLLKRSIYCSEIWLLEIYS